MKVPALIRNWAGKCVLTTGAGSLFAGWFATFWDPTGLSEIAYGAAIIGATLFGGHTYS